MEEEASLLPITRSCTCVYFYFSTYLRRLHVQHFRNPSLRKGSIHQGKDEMHTRKTLPQLVVLLCISVLVYNNCLTQYVDNTCTDQIYSDQIY